MSRFAFVLAPVALAANLLAAPQPALPDAFYSGHLADGRALQLLLSGSGRERAAILHVEGNPYSISLGNRTNTAQGFVFDCGPFSEAERWSVTNLFVGSDGLPASARGWMVTHRSGSAVAFSATNVASQERFTRKRGGRIAGRGGGKAFSASWPAFRNGVPIHEALFRCFAAEAKGEVGNFTAGAYANLWEGLKGGGASWDWEGSLEIRIVWLATNLVSLCELRYEYTGGAHGNAAFVGRNFVLESGRAREFKLPELFRPGVNWTNALSPLCLRELRRQKAAWTLPDASPDMQVNGFAADDLASFNVDGTGLIIHFSDYSVGPHSDGLFSVLIPWKELESLLRMDSPARLLSSKSIR